MEKNQIVVSPKSVALLLGTIATLLIFASIISQIILYSTDDTFYFSTTFYVDAEYNIPTLFSTFILFCASLLLALITFFERKQGNVDMRYWAILALGFLYMAVDETIQIHERFGIPFRRLLNNEHLGILHHFWIIPGIAIVIILGLFFLRFYLRLPKKTRRNFFISAFLYIGGAIGIENIGGYYTQLYGENTLSYTMIATVEEGLEMAGVIVFIWSLLIYLSEKYGEMRFLLKRSSKS